MAADIYIGTRVSSELKAAFRAVAQQQELSESTLLKQLLNVMVGRPGAACSTAVKPTPPARNLRVCVRLQREDRRLLAERAQARHLKPATYVSSLVSAHLRRHAPLPKREIGVLIQSVNELGAIGRNLNQLARAMNQGGRPGGPSRDELKALLKACSGLRDYVRELIEANLKAWEVEHEAAD